jgi:hypothetical protein
MTVMRRLTVAWVVCAGFASVAHAAPFMLSIKGRIANTNDPAHSVYQISEAELLALPVHSITTSTTWTPTSTFTGPLLSDVLERAGAQTDSVEVHTLDDYSYTIHVSEARKYGAILAYSKNGVRLKTSDFGPLFLVYPRDTYPAQLSGAAADAKFVWQIDALILK